ncbi:hypothetical protein HY373_01965 [Candidatus Berkelbacteria bacterium]|nr:hypothetical protein [Candidatus Berkelbacteria bacterium]MBI4029924.1 hypothetical protein [Candidatus Berkelbacteria bacterium]
MENFFAFYQKFLDFFPEQYQYQLSWLIVIAAGIVLYLFLRRLYWIVILVVLLVPAAIPALRQIITQSFDFIKKIFQGG